MNVYIGLDISTSKIGMALIAEDQTLVETKLVKLNSANSLETRAMNFAMHLITFLGPKYKAIGVFVEEPASIFSMGRSSAHTISKLQRFNGMCCYAIATGLGMSAKLIPVRSARSSVGIKVKRGDNTKLEVIKWVKQKYPKDFLFEITRYGNPKPGTDDMADAIVVALAGINQKKLDK